jgi:hypothetical protein
MSANPVLDRVKALVALDPARTAAVRCSRVFGRTHLPTVVPDTYFSFSLHTYSIKSVS